MKLCLALLIVVVVGFIGAVIGTVAIQLVTAFIEWDSSIVLMPPSEWGGAFRAFFIVCWIGFGFIICHSCGY